MSTVTSTTQQQKKYSEKICLAIFLALYAFVFIFRIPRIVFEVEVFIWIQIIVYGLLGIGGVLLFRNTFVKGFQLWKTDTLKSILWLLGSFAGSIIATQIASLPAYLMGIEAPQNDANVLVAVQMLGIPLSILIIGLAGPIVEEVIYRAFLIKKGKIPLWVCVLLSSVVFALAHIHGLSLVDFIGILPHFAVALVYGIAYASTGNITLPLIIHVMNNTFAVILLNRI